MARNDGNPLLYMSYLVIKKRCYGVSMTGTITAGTMVIADTTASTARAISQATVTTAPVSQVLGIVASATALSTGIYPVDVYIAFAE